MAITEVERRTHDEDARELVALSDAAAVADRAVGEAARSGRVTAEHIRASLGAHQVHDDAAEVFRRAYYPRSSRVYAVFGEVLVVSRLGRRTRMVWSR